MAVSKYGKIIARIRAREEARRERVYQETCWMYGQLTMMESDIRTRALLGDLVTFPGSDVSRLPTLRLHYPQATERPQPVKRKAWWRFW